MLPTRFERSTINLAHFDRRNELIDPLEQRYDYSRFDKLLCGLIRAAIKKRIFPKVLYQFIRSIGTLTRFYFKETTQGFLNLNYAFIKFHEYLSGEEVPPAHIEPFRAPIFVHIIKYEAKFILKLAEEMEKRINCRNKTFEGYLFDQENDLYYFKNGIEFKTGSEMNDIRAKFRIAPVQPYCSKTRSLVFMFVFCLFP